MYANYSAFIDRSEVRIFQADQSTQAMPMKVLPVDAAGFAEWEPTAEQTTAPARELQYVLRAYDKGGNFDETNPQPLWLVLDNGTRTDVPPQDTLGQPPNELLASYGATVRSRFATFRWAAARSRCAAAAFLPHHSCLRRG